MVPNERFEIRLAAEAEPDFLALTPEHRARIQRVVEGIAQMAALSPPQFPGWFGRYQLGPPVMRAEAAGMHIIFVLDCVGRSLRVCGVEPAAGRRQRVSRQQERLAFV